MSSIEQAATSLAARSSATEFRYLPLDAIVASKTNPRKTFDPAYISDLARSIREVGVLEPVLVRPAGDVRFELISGECRWRAAKEAQVSTIPVRVKSLSDNEVLEVQVIENLQRRDLSPLEEAEGYRQLLATKKYTVEKIAGRIAMSVKYVYDRVRLLDLIAQAQQLLRDGRITAGHGILLARLQAADQKRAIDPQERALFESEGGLFSEKESEDRDPISHMKVRSVREFNGWVAEHVRFDPAKDADPMLFPETALKLTQAKAENVKVVTITHNSYIQEDARHDKERTYGPQSWERADGTSKSKTCEHSVLGVIAAGRGRGEAFDVCIAKEKCKTHWSRWQKDREKRASGGTPSRGPGSVGAHNQKQAERERREDEKRKKEAAEYEAFKVRFKKAAPAIAKAFVASIRKAPANAGGILGQFLLDKVRDFSGLKKRAAELIPAGKSAEDLVRYLVFVDVYGDITDEWAGPREIPKVAKTFGIDFKRLLDEVAPAEKPKWFLEQRALSGGSPVWYVCCPRNNGEGHNRIETHYTEADALKALAKRNGEPAPKKPAKATSGSQQKKRSVSQARA